jgi:hypothetical protein
VILARLSTESIRQSSFFLVLWEARMNFDTQEEFLEALAWYSWKNLVMLPYIFFFETIQ